MITRLSDIAFFGALILSVANIFAAIFGLGPAISWVSGQYVPGWISAPLALFGFLALIYIWISALLSGRAGMAIYWLNAAVAPFGYGLLGLPYLAGLAIALAPIPFYNVLHWIAARARDR